MCATTFSNRWLSTLPARPLWLLACLVVVCASYSAGSLPSWPHGAHQEPSALIPAADSPSAELADTSDAPGRWGVSGPFRCVMRGRMLYAQLRDPDAVGVRRVVFEWTASLSDLIDRRSTFRFSDRVQRRYVVNVASDHEPHTHPVVIPLPSTPAKTRVVIRAQGGRNALSTGVTACWTGKKIHRPGPVDLIATLSLNKIIAIIQLPSNPNGPIDGLILRWCPVTDLDCPPEDVHFGEKRSHVEHSFATLLDPTEDNEDTEHELCAAAYNIREQERLVGPMTCERAKPALPLNYRTWGFYRPAKGATAKKRVS